MKKLLFAAYSLDIGGIEKALVTMANFLQTKGYEITLVLEKKQGIFLPEVHPSIQIIEYAPNDSKNTLKRKWINFCKRMKFTRMYKNKFDFSASFATYSLMSSFVSRIASKNSCLWGHADYLTLFQGDKAQVREFFQERKYNEFQHIVFVSEEGKDSFVQVFPEAKEKTVVCNNLIDADKIRKMAEEPIELQKEEITTFINVGRQEEKQKKLTRLIEAAERLKKEGYSFRILLVGDGEDQALYKKQVQDKQLEEQILFLGKMENPYPYFKIADCVILTSDYEGYPVVFLESFVLNKPLITTKVSDYQEVENGRGYVTEKETKDIYEKMKSIIENGYEITSQFNPTQYNEAIFAQLEKIIEEKNEKCH